MSENLLTLLVAMTPIGELRAAIPLGILQFEISWPLAFLLAVVGNFLPIPFILLALRTIGDRIEAMDNPLGAVLRWRTHQIQARWARPVDRFGIWAIVALVAIPLPFTGAWTGSLAVWALRMPVQRGLLAIAIGIAIAGVIVTALTLGGMLAAGRWAGD